LPHEAEHHLSFPSTSGCDKVQQIYKSVALEVYVATKKPRIMITLDPEVAEVYRLFASLENRRTSSVLAEMLTEAAPSIASATTLLTQAKATSKLARSELADGLADGLIDLKTALGRLGNPAVEFQKEIDDLIEKLSCPQPYNMGATNG